MSAPGPVIDIDIMIGFHIVVPLLSGRKNVEPPVNRGIPNKRSQMTNHVDRPLPIYLHGKEIPKTNSCTKHVPPAAENRKQVEDDWYLRKDASLTTGGSNMSRTLRRISSTSSAGKR